MHKKLTINNTPLQMRVSSKKMLGEEEGEDYPQCCKRLSDCFSEL